MTKTKKIIGIIVILLILGGTGYYAYAGDMVDNPSLEPALKPNSTRDDADKPEETQPEPADQDSEGSSDTDDSPEQATFEPKQVYSEERFRIVQTSRTGYKVTLYAIINRPDQRDYYMQQLKDYKQAALDYMKTNKLPTNNITWDPEEAENA